MAGGWSRAAPSTTRARSAASSRPFAAGTPSTARCRRGSRSCWKARRRRERPSLPPFLQANREELAAADIAIVTDTNSWDIDTPAITYALRGLIYVEVTLYGPSRDLHSGLYGGAVVNPINALTQVLGQLHDQHGRVQIPGFYDDVREIAPTEAEAWRKLHFDEKAFLDEIGLHSSVGEAGRTVLERLWARPTCDINGIWGGYTGAGAKTVIASEASAKLSCRLVVDQDPARILEGLKSFLDARTPPDCRWEVQGAGGAPGLRIDTGNRFVTAARAGLKEIYRRDPVLVGVGGLDPGGRLDETVSGAGFDPGRLRAGRRPHPQPERKIRTEMSAQRHPQPRRDPGPDGSPAGAVRRQPASEYRGKSPASLDRSPPLLPRWGPRGEIFIAPGSSRSLTGATDRQGEGV